MRAFYLPVVLFVLAACATPPEIIGHLPAEDIRAIELLVSRRADIRKPILRIDADRPDLATIQTGRDDNAGDISQRFTVAKRHGQWIIVSQIDEERIIITTHH